MAKRLVVYGAGAIGAQLGSRLHSGGHDVTLVEPWAPQRKAIARDGVTIHDSASGKPDEHHIPPVISPDDLPRLPGPIDILFMCVKSYDTMRSIEIALPHLAPDGLLVSMQNSINEEWLAPVVGAERLVGGVILINAVLLTPGHVTATASVSMASATAMPGVYVGEYLAPVGQKAREVAAILDAVWPAQVIDDLMHQRWSKLAINTMMNSVSAITGLRSASMLANPEARAALINLGAEVLRVASAEGYPLGSIMADYPADVVYEGAAGRSSVMDDGLAERAKRVSDDAATSMLQDVLRKRQTEVDYFSGLIGVKGREHGVPTPYCDAMTELAHRVEAGSQEPTPEVLLEVSRLVSR